MERSFHLFLLLAGLLASLPKKAVTELFFLLGRPLLPLFRRLLLLSREDIYLLDFSDGPPLLLLLYLPSEPTVLSKNSLVKHHHFLLPKVLLEQMCDLLQGRVLLVLCNEVLDHLLQVLQCLASLLPCNLSDDVEELLACLLPCLLPTELGHNLLDASLLPTKLASKLLHQRMERSFHLFLLLAGLLASLPKKAVTELFFLLGRPLLPLFRRLLLSREDIYLLDFFLVFDRRDNSFEFSLWRGRKIS